MYYSNVCSCYLRTETFFANYPTDYFFKFVLNYIPRTEIIRCYIMNLWYVLLYSKKNFYYWIESFSSEDSSGWPWLIWYSIFWFWKRSCIIMKGILELHAFWNLPFTLFILALCFVQIQFFRCLVNEFGILSFQEKYFLLPLDSNFFDTTRLPPERFYPTHSGVRLGNSFMTKLYRPLVPGSRT